MKFTSSILVSITLVACLLATNVWASDVQLIGSGSAPDTISQADVKMIFLGKKTKWDDGSKITFVILESSDTHTSFLENNVGKTPSQFKKYWTKIVFTGKGKKPQSFSSEAELVEYISANSGTVGYVSSGTDIGSSKAISIN